MGIATAVCPVRDVGGMLPVAHCQQRRRLTVWKPGRICRLDLRARLCHNEIMYSCLTIRLVLNIVTMRSDCDNLVAAIVLHKGIESAIFIHSSWQCWGAVRTLCWWGWCRKKSVHPCNDSEVARHSPVLQVPTAISAAGPHHWRMPAGQRRQTFSWFLLGHAKKP